MRIRYIDVPPGQTPTFEATDYIGDLVFDKSGNVASLEQNRWSLDGSFRIFREVAYWSDEISDEEGEFGTNPVVTIRTSSYVDGTGISIVSPQYTELTVKWWHGTSIVAQGNYTGRTIVIEQVANYNKVSFTVTKTEPYRRARIDQILLGVIREFDETTSVSASVVNETDLLSSSLPASAFNWELRARNAYIFQQKQPIQVYGDSLIGVYYVDSAKRLSQDRYRVTASDAIGVLGSQYFPGGAYLTGVSAHALARAICGDFAVQIDAPDRTMYGLLLPQTRREALQQLCFAWGVTVSTHGRSGIRIFNIPEEVNQIPANKTYIGTGIEEQPKVTKVTLIAHYYEQDDSGSIEIAGTKYADYQYTFTASDPATVGNEVTISEATLADYWSAQETADRILEYYQRRQIVTSRVIYDGYALGDRVRQLSPWGTTVDGNIESLSITLSHLTAAEVRTR